MRTNTRVEFGLYDVTARGDSAPSCTTARPFCNLGRDLLLESVPSQNKYGTLESEQWLMDGSFAFFPEVPEQYFWGLWSATQSDKSGVFADPPVLDIPCREHRPCPRRPAPCTATSIRWSRCSGACTSSGAETHNTATPAKSAPDRRLE